MGTRRLAAARWACALALCTLCACGFRLLRGGPVFGAALISIEPFAERGPIGLTGALAAALPPRLAAVGVQVTHAPNEAQAVLSGQLSLLTYPGGTLSSVLLYNVDLTVAAELHDAEGRLLWRHDCTLREHFLPPDPGTFPEPLTLETRRRVALLRLAERAAATLADALALAAEWHRSQAPGAGGPPA